MFDSLQSRLGGVFDKMKGRGEAEAVVQFAIDFLGDPRMNDLTDDKWKLLDEALPDIPNRDNIPREFVVHNPGSELRGMNAVPTGRRAIRSLRKSIESAKAKSVSTIWPR